MSKRWDVLGLGCAAVDDLLFVPAFPDVDVKTRVTRSERQCGGLGATALVAAARLGARCAYAAVLGDDPLSRFVEEALAREGVDTSVVMRRAEAQPVHSTIIVGEAGHTRNIFFELGGATGADDLLPEPDVIRAARVLFVDHYGMTGNLRAAPIALAAGIPVVADFERDNVPRFGELLALVNHLILSSAFACRLTGAGDAAEAARRLWHPGRQAVVVTDGERGCWSVEDGGVPQRQPAFRVVPVDTTGCGDVFHGAYAAALAEGRTLFERVRFASAAAALKATHPGAQKGAPTRGQVETFLSAAPPSVEAKV